MKAYWWSGSIAPCILDVGTIWMCVVSFTARPLYLQGRTPGTLWIGGWVGPRARLDTVPEETKNSLNSGVQTVSPSSLISKSFKH
jgi:hypothetical protein